MAQSGAAYTSDDAGSGNTGNIPRNASDLESRDTVNGWSISNAQYTQGSDEWHACRYYEVGDIEEDIRHVLSDATLGEDLSVNDFLYFAFFTIASGKERSKTCRHER